MGRPPKWLAEDNALCGWGPLRQYWRETNRHEWEAKAQERAEHKARDKRRPKCRCEAYPWPHRPGGGLCRYPDPPLERRQPKPSGRPYRKRYAGLRRQVARANGMHPIKDRAAIDVTMPRVLAMARQLKGQCPQLKYRNMEVTDNGLTGHWQTAGPMM